MNSDPENLRNIHLFSSKFPDIHEPVCHLPFCVDRLGSTLHNLVNHKAPQLSLCLQERPNRMFIKPVRGHAVHSMMKRVFVF